nr:ATP-binding cassette domain-containing protein [Spirochaetales bacterium]
MITCNRIDFSYGKEPLFHQLDLSIAGGSIYGLLGMNGAGKTTLLKLLSGQLFPKGGFSDVLGFNPEKRHPSMLEEIFYLPEEFYLPKYSISEYLKIYSP